MYYVVLTFAMLLGNAQPGRVVITEMDTSSPLPPLNQATAPLGTRISYMERKQVELTLYFLHCGAPTRNDGASVTYECLGMSP